MKKVLFVCLLSAAPLFGCSSNDGPAPNETGEETDTGTPIVEDLAIIGDYDDNFGGTQTISNELWLDAYGSVFHITAYDNAELWVVAQNDADNDYSPSLWSRFDWTVSGGDTYFCQSVYDGVDEQFALNASPADASDPTTTGCGGFSWTQLIP